LLTGIYHLFTWPQQAIFAKTPTSGPAGSAAVQGQQGQHEQQQQQPATSKRGSEQLDTLTDAERKRAKNLAKSVCAWRLAELLSVQSLSGPAACRPPTGTTCGYRHPASLADVTLRAATWAKKARSDDETFKANLGAAVDAHKTWKPAGEATRPKGGAQTVGTVAPTPRMGTKA